MDILCGMLDGASEALLREYVMRYIPDANIVPLSKSGLKKKMSGVASSSILLVILDEGLWQECAAVGGRVSENLGLSKVHRYEGMDSLRGFLEVMFGPLGGDSGEGFESSEVPVDEVSLSGSDGGTSLPEGDVGVSLPEVVSGVSEGGSAVGGVDPYVVARLTAELVEARRLRDEALRGLVTSGIVEEISWGIFSDIDIAARELLLCDMEKGLAGRVAEFEMCERDFLLRLESFESKVRGIEDGLAEDRALLGREREVFEREREALAVEAKFLEELRATLESTGAALDVRETNLVERERSVSDLEARREADSRVSGLEVQLKETERLLSELERSYGALSDEYDMRDRECTSLRERLDLQVDQLVELENRYGALAGYESLFRGTSKSGLMVSPWNFNGRGHHHGFVACGSAESVSVVKDVVRGVLDGLSGRVLVLDLCVDSYLDVALGVKGQHVPFDWLSGDGGLEAVSLRDYSTVDFMSLSTAYINEFYLLSVDWVSLLSDLRKYDSILWVLDVRSLFGKCMLNSLVASGYRGYIAVKASPLSFRSVMLNLAGLPRLSDVVTVCVVDWMESASGVYKRLSSLYRTVVYRGDALRGGV